MSEDSIAQRCLKIGGLFEAEVLVELMLRYWDHPFADQAEYRNDLLETANQILERATEGNQIIDTLSPEDTNLIVAIWYAEHTGLLNDEPSQDVKITSARRAWLESVKKSIPSCFQELD